MYSGLTSSTLEVVNNIETINRMKFSCKMALDLDLTAYLSRFKTML